MNETSAGGAGRLLQTLTDAECWAHLVEHHLGRIAIVVGGVPKIFPINYAAGDNAIVFRSDAGTKLMHGPGSLACFEIDGYIPASGVGWSVVVSGPLDDITGLDDPGSARLRSLSVEPMAPGRYLHWLALRADEVSGRTFLRGWAIPGSRLG